MTKLKKKIEVVGIVLAVEYQNDDGSYAQPGSGIDHGDPGIVFDEFKAMGYDVQAVSLHIDGAYRVEVLS